MAPKTTLWDEIWIVIVGATRSATYVRLGVVVLFFIGTINLMAMSAERRLVRQRCFSPVDWLRRFSQEPPWSRYSEGNQDAVLNSLFKAVKTTNKKYVEIGRRMSRTEEDMGKGRYLEEALGFNAALNLDAERSNASINLHKRFVTAGNIIPILQEFRVPTVFDYLGISLKACDLWVFLGLTTVFRPRVVTVEYNPNYVENDFSALRCSNPRAYTFEGDNLYGASLGALDLAANHRGYQLVYVSTKLDAFFVRKDLLCREEDRLLQVGDFRDRMGIPFGESYLGQQGLQEDLVTDFGAWLTSHPGA